MTDDTTNNTFSATFPTAGASPTPTQTTTNTPTPTVTPTITRTPNVTPSSFKKFVNECEPITIFEMGISCVVVEPSSKVSNDGAASVSISGGTPPYTIIWDNGNVASAIGNLSVGSYGATVVDFYGDYTAKTVCVLTGQTISPTPTPTPTPTPIPSGPVFCMIVRTQYPKGFMGKTYALGNLFIKNTFTVDSFINGQPSWVSDDGNYRIYFNNVPPPGEWQYSATTTLPVQIVNTNYNTIPLNPAQWDVLGGANTFISITNGPCETFGLSPFSIPNPDIELYVVKNDTNCGCEGSIIANANGGNTPYQYSIDGGITYKKFPIFDNLCSGVYTVIVKDDLGFTKSSQITLNEPKLPTNYTVNLTKGVTTSVNNGVLTTKNYQIGLVITPPLPDTATVTFDIVHTNTFNSSITSESASLSTNTVLEKNGSPITYTNVNTKEGTSVNRINGCQNQLIYTTATTEVWQGLTYTNSDTFTLNTTTSVVKNFTSGCDIGSSDDTYYITNISITGCDCCSIQNITV